jgi:hypothetical protein
VKATGTRRNSHAWFRSRDDFSNPTFPNGGAMRPPGTPFAGIPAPSRVQEVAMKRIRAALVLSLLLPCAGAAYAQATFLMGLHGSGLHFPLPSECSPQQACTPFSVPWTGTVTIVTASDANGVYTGGSLLGLDFVTNRASFNLDAIRNSSQAFGEPYSVTLAGHQVASVDFAIHLTPGSGVLAPTVLSFSGLSGGYNEPVSHSVGATFYSATLVPIPEPQSWALLLAGLAATGVLRQIFPLRKSCRAARPAPAIR